MSMLDKMLLVPRLAAEGRLFDRVAEAEHRAWLDMDRPESKRHRTIDAWRSHCRRWGRQELFNLAVRSAVADRLSRYLEPREVEQHA